MRLYIRSVYYALLILNIFLGWRRFPKPHNQNVTHSVSTRAKQLNQLIKISEFHSMNAPNYLTPGAVGYSQLGEYKRRPVARRVGRRFTRSHQQLCSVFVRGYFRKKLSGCYTTPMLIFGKEKVGSNGAQGNPAKAVGTGILREFMCNEPTGPVCVSNPFKRGYGLRRAKWGCRTFFFIPIRS